MIRPVRFGYNEQTAKSNSFQKNSGSDPKLIQEQALKEFDSFVLKLKEAKIDLEKAYKLINTEGIFTEDKIIIFDYVFAHVKNGAQQGSNLHSLP